VAGCDFYAFTVAGAAPDSVSLSEHTTGFPFKSLAGTAADHLFGAGHFSMNEIEYNPIKHE